MPTDQRSFNLHQLTAGHLVKDMRQRALQPAAKAERQQAILDAAESMLQRHPERTANVAEVAQEAGLAKGTVYLYFASKEELLLALHERHVECFFDALLLRLEQPIGVDDILQLARIHILDHPTYLSLCSRCFGMMDKEVPAETAFQFKMKVAGLLQKASVALQKHHPHLVDDSGSRLLMASYATIIGLWQMLHPIPALDALYVQHGFGFFRRDFGVEVERALRALWSGWLNPDQSDPLLRSDTPSSSNPATRSVP